MAKSCNQKLKILYLMELLKEKSESQKPTSMQEIIDYLEQKGIQAERKSIYDDMDALRYYGLDIRYERKRPGGYYLAVPESKREKEEPMKPVCADTQAEEKRRLKLLCPKEFQAEAQRYLGTALSVKEKDEGNVILTVEHSVGPELFGWLTACGKQVKLVKPKKVSAAYRDYLKGIMKEYKE